MEFKTDLQSGTTVTFAGNAISGEATILFATPSDDNWLVVVDTTPFHPISASWPDQPGDKGTLTLQGGEVLSVTDSVTGTLDTATGALWIGKEGAPSPSETIAAVVVHVVSGGQDLSTAVGQRVALAVDATYRQALSVQHTGVHLSSLALNAGASAFWTKEFSNLDTLGAPNFDQAAIALSEIAGDYSSDTYRIGKSLRKKGFDRDSFMAALPEREAEINAVLREFVGTAAAVSVAPAEGPIGDRRTWSTTLRGQDVSMPCGGTHVANLDEITGISVALSPVEEGFVMVTKTAGRAA